MNIIKGDDKTERMLFYYAYEKLIRTKMFPPGRLLFCLFAFQCVLLRSVAYGQDQPSDTTRLTEVVVKGFESNRKLNQTAASVSVISRENLKRFNETSILPAFNTIAGVKMEERSPGSYRISIRGSSLRAPFGVRNVKVYWNDAPFTDAGNNTDINLLDPHVITQVEVLKGPTGSVFGAGDGGVILFKSMPQSFGHQIHLAYSAGSFGLRSLHVGLESGSAAAQSAIDFSEDKSTGYRINSALSRKVFNFVTSFYRGPHEKITLSGFYSDLFYQTPGALTLAELHQDPKQARPAIPSLPGVVSQQAAIDKQQLYFAANHRYTFNAHFSNSLSLTVSPNQFKNPFLIYYQKRSQQNYGARDVARYHFKAGTLSSHVEAGGEFQYTFSNEKDYLNKGGIPDSLRRDDELSTRQYFLFAQWELEMPYHFLLTSALSYNKLAYVLDRFSDYPPSRNNRSFNPILSPRFSLLKTFSPAFSAYISLSYGYSPPSSTEVLAGDRRFNVTLVPEKARSYEAGVRGNVFERKLDYAITGFLMRVSNTIVGRYDGNSEQYFVNAGNTRENGIESALSALLIQDASKELSELMVHWAFTFNHFLFQHYYAGATNLSGNPLTGVPAVTSVVSADVKSKVGIFVNTTYFYNAKVSLNDQNSVSAPGYHLFDFKVGYGHTWYKRHWQMAFGIDNAFNKKFSLGQDFNAFGGRYYNAAPPRSYYVTVSL